MELLPISKLLTERFILHFHLIICLIFLLDFLIRWHYSHYSWCFLRHNFLFLLVSIPYLNIVHAVLSIVTHPLWIFLRLIPLIRGMYAVTIIFSWITRNRVTGLFATYLTFLFTAIYFCSIMFYFVEHGTNPAVTSYWTAFDWALMNVTTVGSNIFGVTKIGQSLAVILAAIGMIFFPIFTVYVTAKFQNKRQSIHPSDTKK
ncbi:MAG: two pore domain potassium channel family protein [Odoribacter sp.]